MKSNILVKQSTALLLGTAVLLALVPFTAGAQTEDRIRAVPAQQPNLCDNLDTVEENVLAKLAERKAASDRAGDYEAKRDERLAKLAVSRSEYDALRETRYSKLRAAATTDDQAAAVEEFVSTVEDLVVDRKAAVDAAIADFEDAIEALLEERSSAIDTYAGELESTVVGIFEDAQDSCDDDATPQEVRTQLQAAMQAMQADAKADRDQYSFRDEFEAVRTERKAAFEAAKTTFLADYEAAKVELKAAFGR